jgi:UDP-N-acetylmuramate--alanine ligase
MVLGEINRVYFIGIGGIGMSALARYFMQLGITVAGYDRNSGRLTNRLTEEGAFIHFNDNIEEIPAEYKGPDKAGTLVVFTPAVPKDHKELKFFRENAYPVLKRSEVLGLITNEKTTIAVAGTHGKTTISTMIAHILTTSGVGCNALLGGISRNYGTNLLVNKQSNYMVTEADEYDRSFLQLHPDYAVISSMDADHLDIYGSAEEMKLAFGRFASQVKEDGILLVKKGVNLKSDSNIQARSYSYSAKEEADFYAQNIRLAHGFYIFDLITPAGEIKNIKLGQPGLYNVENAIAALAIAWLAGSKKESLAHTLEDFKGIQRRFDIHINKPNLVYIDDYAHHPEEIKACIESARELFPGKKITGVFQPHLYSRTRDFAEEFSKSLGLLDRLILLDIYPARELPIEGVNSEMVFNKVEINDKVLCSLNTLMSKISEEKPEVLLTMGAGNIDAYVEPIIKLFS